MSTYWDMQEINITNQTGFPLRISSVGILAHGEWDAYPTATIPDKAEGALAFRTRSVNAAEVGPGPGTVTYLMQDGTSLIINFDMIFADWQTTWVDATASGQRGGNYTVGIVCSEDHWHGQGRRFYSTITITASSTGPNTYRCEQTN